MILLSFSFDSLKGLSCPLDAQTVLEDLIVHHSYKANLPFLMMLETVESREFRSNLSHYCVLVGCLVDLFTAVHHSNEANILSGIES